MAKALQLARRGLYSTAPNPRVGCLLVRNDRVIGSGWHQCTGQAHAEINALQDCSGDAAGSTCYVTLEPCAHEGRTPPCSQALIEAGVVRVVAAGEDPNPRVAGGGLRALQQAGIETAAGLLEAEARQLNPGFFKRMREGVPWLRTKLALSLDGRTALASGESRWITAGSARQDVHRLRARSCALVTGIGTVLADDPQLTARPDGQLAARQPLRVVLDSQLRLPVAAALLEQPGTTLVIAAPEAASDRKRRLEDAGADVVTIAADSRYERLIRTLHWLARERAVNEVMVEAGPELNGSLLETGLVDEMVVYMAPLLLGSDARPAFGLSGIHSMQERVSLKLIDARQVGQDMRLTYYPLVSHSGSTG